jgi:hypothetical protein
MKFLYYIIEKLLICREKGVKNIFGNFGFPGMPKEKTQRSIELFGTKVLPEIEKIISKGNAAK